MRDLEECMDTAWIGKDGNGDLAVFTTGGRVSAPTSSSPEEEEEALSCPVIGGADVVSNFPCTDSFESFATRGFFSYDWDGHGYALQASPKVKLTYEQAPQCIKEIVDRNTMPNKRCS